MKDNIIAIETDYTVEQNFSALGSEYFENYNKNHLPIIGTIDSKTNKLVLVVHESVQKELMHVVNALNMGGINAI